ncbi:MAG: folate family ECF transporter S component [Ruminococcaceae bacterium]|nr:folate family ECF transporter S component [Oscillospiraceae bacterium]
MKMYSTCFSREYWQQSLREMKDLRKLVFAALMIAACIILARFKIPLGENLNLNVTFLARALCATVCGPVLSIVFAAAEDTLSFFLSSGGYAYFPGYMITTALGCLVYALCFYRRRITMRSLILAKVVTNVQNVFLGSLWSAMLYGKGYLFYLTSSAWKNLLYLPLQVLMLVVVLQALLPVMHRLHWAPNQLEEGRIPW